ncbi:DNA helicase/exodeoxyribonuclease V, subunit A [Dethiosulfatibacter aminovorans DSM 17477]|uniref:ATP-dependent helicase/nuclease subunit A n=1 Tax=Dethiosulfatibacter aminovorans DSM 17477 TaxID=1121476 RepID=A0A1M6K2K8_9FIRM|nr:helicase-exonuclease AddAB subunit AddA [Dethiosulfatibacter aminovorans]SHJ53155.1 DNA helicase/exodeoxyribonuclease V, subunit A [Dethiosulfatibacter aminovorans DSM 17477]
MVKWTEQQQSAIDNRSKNLLVSAAAGSGKTAVLVERIIRSVIDDNTNIDRFLVVTFTNAAASGMKEKIKEAMISSMNEINGAFLKKQLGQIGNSSISTMHSFCFDIIRKYFYLIDLDPDFKIMDTNDSEILLEETVNDLLERRYEEKDGSFLLLIDSFSENRGDERIVSLVKRLYKTVLSYPNPMGWLRDAVDQLDVSLGEVDDTLWIRILKNEGGKYLDFAEDILKDAISICPEDLPYFDTLQEDRSNLYNLKVLLENDFERFCMTAGALSHPRLKTLRKDKKEMFDPELIEEVKYSREKYKKTVDGIKKHMPKSSYSAMARDLEFMHPIMEALYSFVEDLHHEFRRRKKEMKSLDFNDAEHLALEILEEDEASVYYRNKFKYIYVDEYQDSNGIQEELINRVKRENNLFMVGDVKQSIYRFRQADPTLFIEKYNNYKKPSEKDSLVLLNKNFRSRGEILDFTNYLFSKLMNEELGEIDYNEDAYLYRGTSFEAGEKPLEINVIEKKMEESENGEEGEFIDQELLELKTNELEARFIANKIKELKAGETYDAKNKCWRKIRYSDIVILLRSAANWASVFEDVFYNEGIPFYSDVSNSYFDTVEIKVMMNVLRIIDNIKQDIPLLSVMRSPFGGFSIDELVKIRRLKKDGEFFSAFLKSDDLENERLKGKIEKFRGQVEEWRFKSRTISLSRLLWEIMIDTKYYYFNGLMKNGNLKQANLRLLVDRAGVFQKDGYSGISDFIKYMDRVRKSSGDMMTAKILGENDDVVRLMTIHKSKGLEFPVVICAGLNKKFNKSDLTGDLILSRKCLLAPKYINREESIYKETLPRFASKIQINRENLSEEMRVLYVALTRAVDKLILTGTVDDFTKWKEKWKKEKIDYINTLSASSYLDWIGYILNKEESVYEVHKVSILHFTKSNDYESLETRDCLERIFQGEWRDDEVYESINRKMNWKYEFGERSFVPDKITVTDIKELRGENKNLRNRIPALRDIPLFKSRVSGFTPAEIGTINHSVLQLIKLSGDMDHDYIKDSINEMIDKKQLTEEEAGVVEIERILDFYSSSLGRRMVKSQEVYREQPFILKKSEGDIVQGPGKGRTILVQGIIDCYFKEKGELVLVDYKTDRVFDDVDNLVEHYSPQIHTYREALEKLTGLKVKESYLYLINSSKAIKVN